MSRFQRRTPIKPARRRPSQNLPIIKNNNKKNGKLTASQKVFADEWLIDRNGTRAYKVGYPYIKNDESAAACASALLKIPKVEAYVNARLEILSEKAGIDTQWVLERYKLLTEYHLSDFFDDEGNLKPLSEIPKDSLYAVCGFRNMKQVITESRADGSSKDTMTFLQNLKFPNKKDVLDSIGKYLGMFEKDNEQKRPIVPVQINVELTD